MRQDKRPWEARPRPPPPPPARKKYKFKPGTCALREIRKYQKSTEPIIPKAPFSRLVREIVWEYSDNVSRVTAGALGALQEATEDIATSLFHDSVLCHVHAKFRSASSSSDADGCMSDTAGKRFDRIYFICSAAQRALAAFFSDSDSTNVAANFAPEIRIQDPFAYDGFFDA
ncbi:hypothetical protein L7F22_031152 [Adiantum nelumboides]|nr:hypothetical protein [Adiantum nelumboides]